MSQIYYAIINKQRYMARRKRADSPSKLDKKPHAMAAEEIDTEHSNFVYDKDNSKSVHNQPWTALTAASVILTGAIIFVEFLITHVVERLSQDARTRGANFSQNMGANVLLGCSLVIIVLLVKQFVKYQEFQQHQNRNLFGAARKTPINGLTRISVQKFNKQCRETTMKSVAKLTSSAEYKQMLLNKGRLQANWNWQTKQLIESRRNAGEILDVEESFSESLCWEDSKEIEAEIIKVDQELLKSGM